MLYFYCCESLTRAGSCPTKCRDSRGVYDQILRKMQKKRRKKEVKDEKQKKGGKVAKEKRRNEEEKRREKTKKDIEIKEDANDKYKL